MTGSKDELSSERAALANVCDELLATEASYVATLRTVVEIFYVPLLRVSEEGAAAPRKTGSQVTAQDIHTVFGCVKQLLVTHEELQSALQAARPAGAQALATTLATAAGEGLQAYTEHVKTFSPSQQHHAALLERDAPYRHGLRLLELQPRCHGLDLQSLLVTTVQRLPRYLLLLREMAKHAPLAEPSALGVLREAQAAIDALTGDVNESVGQAMRAVSVANDVLHRTDLVAAGRELLKEGGVMLLKHADHGGGAKESRRTAFLFSDLFVLAKVADDQQGVRKHLAAHVSASAHVAHLATSHVERFPLERVLLLDCARVYDSEQGEQRACAEPGHALTQAFLLLGFEPPAPAELPSFFLLAVPGADGAAGATALLHAEGAGASTAWGDAALAAAGRRQRGAPSSRAPSFAAAGPSSSASLVSRRSSLPGAKGAAGKGASLFAALQCVCAHADRPAAEALKAAAAKIGAAIGVGVPKFNAGDEKGCFEAYRAAAAELAQASPLYEVRHGLDSALTKAAAQKAPADQAWTIRNAFDAVTELAKQ